MELYISLLLFQIENLLNFTNDGEQTLPKNSVATANGIDPYTMTPIVKDKQKVEESTEDATETDAEEIKKSIKVSPAVPVQYLS